jgi:hypothetical protein
VKTAHSHLLHTPYIDSIGLVSCDWRVQDAARGWMCFPEVDLGLALGDGAWTDWWSPPIQCKLFKHLSSVLASAFIVTLNADQLLMFALYRIVRPAQLDFSAFLC